MDADFGARADGRHRLSLGEDLGVWTDADLQVLGPHALGDQDVLEPARFVRAGPNLLQVGADDRRDRRSQAFGFAGVASRLLLDDAFEQAGHEGDAAGLDGLQVARREQPRRVRPACAGSRVRQDVGERGNRRQRSRAANRRHRILEIQQLTCGGRDAREVVDLPVTHANESSGRGRRRRAARRGR